MFAHHLTYIRNNSLTHEIYAKTLSFATYAIMQLYIDHFLVLNLHIYLTMSFTLNYSTCTLLIFPC